MRIVKFEAAIKQVGADQEEIERGQSSWGGEGRNETTPTSESDLCQLFLPIQFSYSQNFAH